MALGEFELIERYFRPPVRRAVLGGGDDCALLMPAAGMQLAVSTDLLVEGRHFLSTVAPDRLGHKSLAVNLSDLAACGAEPLAFTLALSLPRADPTFLAPFARGMLDLAEQHHIELIGGDTTSGPLTITITVMGQLPPGQAILRSGARPGDDLWVSGCLGDARLALEVFRGRAELAGEAFTAVREAMERPQPRVALGQALRGVASAAIDLSDGLLGDLAHIRERSGVGASVWFDALPRSAALDTQPESVRRECLLEGGDDYELLFTAPASNADAVRAAGLAAGTPVTRIGRIVAAAEGLRVFARSHGSEPLDLSSFTGFDHFRA